MLPENWGPIFGMENYKDKLGDLTWLGDPELADVCWVQVEGDAPSTDQTSPSQLAWERAKALLKESDWSVLPDVPMTAGKRIQWQEYRNALREIKLQPDFPNNINWPNKPE